MELIARDPRTIGKQPWEVRPESFVLVGFRRSPLSKTPLRYTQDWHDMIIWGRTQDWYTWPKAEIGWKPRGQMGSSLPMDDDSLILFVSLVIFSFEFIYF